MARAYYYLHRPNTISWPKSIAFVSPQFTQISGAAGATGARIALAEWMGLRLAWTGNGYRMVEHPCIGGAAGLWKWIGYPGRDRATRWVIAPGMAGLLAASGFWQLVNSREWSIVDLSLLEPGREVGETARGKPGFVLLDDPPTIVAARRLGCRSPFKLLDIRNYGVGKLPGDDASEEQLLAMRQWFYNYYGLCQRRRLGGLRTTSGSQAWHGWRSSFMPPAVLIHANTEALSLERDCVHAGRLEAFHIGAIRQTVYNLDINSSYTHAALTTNQPARLKGCRQLSISEIHARVRDGYIVSADCHVRSEDRLFPVRRQGITIYPVGSYRCQLAWPELCAALALNAVAQVYKAAWYEPDDLLSVWGMSLYAEAIEAKNRGDKMMSSTIKRILLSLYGRFARWEPRWQVDPYLLPPKEYTIWQAINPETREVQRCRSIGRLCQREVDHVEPGDSCPQVTAHVYSQARIRLSALIAMAGADNVVYCDTDSLFVLEDGYLALRDNGMIDATELGRLKIAAVWPWLVIRGLKHYESPDSQVHSGVPEHAEQVGPWRWEWTAQEAIAGSLAQHREPVAYVQRRGAAHSGLYRHGVVTESGRVLPLTLNEEVTNG
jgi:hypothetical protein